MTIMMETTIEIEIIVEGTPVKYYPAVRFKSNGDPGDPAEGGYCEDMGVYVYKDGKKVEITDFIEKDLLEDLSIQLYEETYF